MSKLFVDKSLCVGCGFCAGSESNFFEISEDSTAEVKENVNIKQDGTAEIKEKNITKNIEELKELCPFGAIQIEE